MHAFLSQAETLAQICRNRLLNVETASPILFPYIIFYYSQIKIYKNCSLFRFYIGIFCTLVLIIHGLQSKRTHIQRVLGQRKVSPEQKLLGISSLLKWMQGFNYVRYHKYYWNDVRGHQHVVQYKFLNLLFHVWRSLRSLIGLSFCVVICAISLIYIQPPVWVVWNTRPRKRQERKPLTLKV